MRQVTREIRGAYISMLSPLTYKGVLIPTVGSLLNGSGAIISLQSGVSFESYINIINQFRSSNELKNGTDYPTSLTLDINTVFNGSSYNVAGNEWVEEITDLVNELLYDNEVFRLKEFGINDDRFIITSTRSYSQPMPLQYTDTSRVFRVVLVFEHTIQRVQSETTEPELWIKTI